MLTGASLFWKQSSLFSFDEHSKFLWGNYSVQPFLQFFTFYFLFIQNQFHVFKKNKSESCTNHQQLMNQTSPYKWSCVLFQSSQKILLSRYVMCYLPVEHRALLIHLDQHEQQSTQHQERTATNLLPLFEQDQLDAPVI